MPDCSQPDEASLARLTTEQRNPASEEIDRLSSLEIVRLMNAEDGSVAAAVGREAEPIAEAIDVVARALRSGGRLIYMGAGTSGRLGVLDAAECPPTFNSPPEQVIGLIAGGREALVKAVDGAEDNPQTGEDDLRAVGLSSLDVVVGIATSGRTPYVIGGLEFARREGAFTIGFSCNRDSDLHQHSDLVIAPVVGPEVISGSTRLKGGAATKMVLNMLTTGAMVLLGKTFGNQMVDLRATNQKLTVRSRRIVAELTGLSTEQAAELLDACDGEVKTAIVAHLHGAGTGREAAEQARVRLNAAEGRLRRALEE